MTNWQLGQRPALTGLRGVAIVLVLLAHFDNPTTSPLTGAGAVGVSMFFTLSGFLITALLLEERQATGRVSLGDFYRRRARRLMPALWAMVLAVLALQAFGRSVGVDAPMAVAALASVSNWWQNAHGFGHALGHTWSLSIEEQFYLFWPVALTVASRWGRRAVAAVAVVVIGCSGLALAIPGGSDDKGTVEQAGAIMAGCLLAAVVSGRPRREAGSYLLAVAGLAGLAPMLWLHGTVPLWAYTAVPPVFTCMVLWSLASGPGPRWLCGPVLGWFGKRSYGIYLWHYPVIYLSSGGGGAIAPWQETQAIRLAVTLAVAELSWRLVEQPFQRRGHATRPHVPVSLLTTPTPLVPTE